MNMRGIRYLFYGLVLMLSCTASIYASVGIGIDGITLTADVTDYTPMAAEAQADNIILETSNRTDAMTPTKATYLGYAHGTGPAFNSDVPLWRTSHAYRHSQ